MKVFKWPMVVFHHCPSCEKGYKDHEFLTPCPRCKLDPKDAIKLSDVERRERNNRAAEIRREAE